MLQDQSPGTPAAAAMAAASPPAGVVLRPMEPADAGQVLAVYQAGLDTGQASFETAAPDWEAFDAAKLPAHRFTAADADGQVLGWIAVSPVSARRVYAGVVEHSVYVLPGSPPPRDRRGAAAGAHRLHRGGGDLDHPEQPVPGEHRQRAAAPAGRVPRSWGPGSGSPAITAGGGTP